MRSEVLRIETGFRPAVVDITARCRAFVLDGADGLLSVFVPHATAGVAIMETGSGSEEDLLQVLDGLLPLGGGWAHRHGSPGHGRDHVLPAIISPSVTIPVVEGLLQLGTWQSVCLVDTNGDNPHRQLRLSFLEA